MLRHTSGVICISLSGQRLAALELPPMAGGNQESQRTAFTVSVDLAAGVSTGISASDRAPDDSGARTQRRIPRDQACPDRSSTRRR